MHEQNENINKEIDSVLKNRISGIEEYNNQIEKYSSRVQQFSSNQRNISKLKDRPFEIIKSVKQKGKRMNISGKRV